MEEDFAPEKIRLYSAGVLTYSDIASFLDQLNQRHMFVDATVSSTEPPAAGFSEIALSLLVASTSIPYLKGFFSTWGEEDARQLRAELLKLLERGRRGKSGRGFLPLTIHLSRSDDLDRSSITNARPVQLPSSTD